MFSRKRTATALAVLVLLGLPAAAADKYSVSQSPHRKVAIYRAEPNQSPPPPPRLAPGDQFEIAPVPEDEDHLNGSQPSMPMQGSMNANPWMADGGCSCGNSGCDGSCGGGCGGGCGSQCAIGGCCVPYWSHRSSIFGDVLWLHATGNNVAYAIQQNGVGGPGTTPNGSVGTVNSPYEAAFRVGFAKRIDDCSSVVVTYASFLSHGDDALVAGQGIGDTVASLVLHPNTVNAGSTSSLVQAYHDVDFRTADVEYSTLLYGGCRTAINFNIGARYGKLNQEFQQLGNFTPPTGTIQTDTRVTFEGGGLKVGLDGQRQLGASRWSFYGKGFLSVLFCQANANFNQVDNTSTIVQATSNWRDQRVLPVLEYEVGLSWTSCSGRWRSTIGYYTAFWYNAITTSEYIQAVQTNNYVGLGQTVNFDGLVSRLEYRF